MALLDLQPGTSFFEYHAGGFSRYMHACATTVTGWQVASGHGQIMALGSCKFECPDRVHPLYHYYSDIGDDVS